MTHEELPAEDRAHLALLDLEVYGGAEALEATFVALVRRYPEHGPVLCVHDPEVLADLEARAAYTRATGESPWG